jgi:NAD dependent epimerase/dehydratase family enzyme
MTDPGPSTAGAARSGDGPAGRTAVVAGASGFIGQVLIRELADEGYRVRTIGRQGADARWGDAEGIRRLLDGADLLVNLAGKSVNCRYGIANRREILRSRVETTAELGRAIQDSARPVPVWINASTATVYRHATDHAQTESTGELGDDFSPSVGRAWEAALFAPDLPSTRRVALRIAIVLGRDGALQPLLGLARSGLGGPQLDGRFPGRPSRIRAGAHHVFQPTHGRQVFSWLHIDDLVGIIRFVRDTPAIAGPVNASSPEPVTNRRLMKVLRGAVGMPIGLAANRWMLEVGMWLFRTEPELVLKSRWVVPETLERAGFRFRWPHLDEAVADIVRR